VKNRELWVVVPAYNEAASISAVLASLRGFGYDTVCVVNDGSTDQTAQLARAGGAHVLDHVTNLGQGAALQTGISYALARGADYICTFDADGQHAAGSIDDLLIELQRSGADIAVGSRFLYANASMPLARRLLLKAALIFTRVHARVKITDTHNGLRLLTRRAAEAIEIEQPGMAHASEILQKIGNRKLTLVEVPVTVAYTEYSKRKGQSGFESVRILLDLLYGSLAVRR